MKHNLVQANGNKVAELLKLINQENNKQDQNHLEMIVQ